MKLISQIMKRYRDIYQQTSLQYTLGSGGSRISHWGAPSHGGGTDLRHIHFLAKTYVKTKELDPVGGGRRRRPPGSANALGKVQLNTKLNIRGLSPRGHYHIFRTHIRENVNTIQVTWWNFCGILLTSFYGEILMLYASRPYFGWGQIMYRFEINE